MILLIALLAACGRSEAWIAYGFKSGMSRFEVERYLSDNGSLVITEDAQQTYAGPDGDQARYNLVYCSTPQRLYLMKFRLPDSRDAFIEARKKYASRYGEPEGADSAASDSTSTDWADVDVSLIWYLSESETILLNHDSAGTSAEFQDISVCK